VQTTLDLVSRYCGVPKEEITYTCGGINHMDWFLRLEHKGRDLYPVLREVFERPEYYKNEKVRGEVFRHFGYFMTESTGHLSEYVPWFRKNRKALGLYCDEPSFGGESGAYYSWCRTVADYYSGHDPLEYESTRIDKRSVEYCSYIMEAIATGRPFRFMGNVRNDGYITNLPRGCCVEVPVFADDAGLHPTVVGDLPVQCAALCLTNINVQMLAAEAALTSDPEKLMQAVARSRKRARWPRRCSRRSAPGSRTSKARASPRGPPSAFPRTAVRWMFRSIRRLPLASDSRRSSINAKPSRPAMGSAERR
jgi:alpha-galactosidase